MTGNIDYRYLCAEVLPSQEENYEQCCMKSQHSLDPPFVPIHRMPEGWKDPEGRTKEFTQYESSNSPVHATREILAFFVQHNESLGTGVNVLSVAVYL